MDIKEYLLKGPHTASGIASEAGVTLSNVVQQLKKMETRGEVKYSYLRRDGPGKPAKLYRLVDQVEIKGVIGNTRIDIKIDPTDWEKAILNVFRIPQKEFREYVMKWLDILYTLPSNESPGLGKSELIYVFGSVARGNADPDSDIDILIVVEGEVFGDICEEPILIQGPKGYVTINPLSYSSNEFKKSKDKDNNLRELLTEGILIWKKQED